MRGPWAAAALAAAEAALAPCDLSIFAHPIQGVQCQGLDSTPAANSSACAEACCARGVAGCQTWLWSDSGGCWTGNIPCHGWPSEQWNGGSRMAIATPAPPAPPPVWSGLPRLTPRPRQVAGVAQPVASLNGVWMFDPFPPPRDPSGAFKSKPNWTVIPVPAEYMMHGFRVPPTQPTAYRRFFEIPDDWAAEGLRTKVRFDGVYSDAEVWVNGERAGAHLGGFTPFELDITNMVRNGTNNAIDLAVIGASLADTLSSASKYASHDLGGITRKVTLFVVPSVSVSDVYPLTTFDAAYRDAVLSVNITLHNDGPTSAAVSGSCAVRTTSGAPVGAPAALQATVPAGGSVTTEVRIAAQNVSKWDPEHPTLHDIVVTLAAQQSSPGAETAVRFGFREVHVSGNQVFVNGLPVKARGSTRHETHPTHGRSLWGVPPGEGEQWRRDVEVFRGMNVNWIRTSHYPPGEEFVAACDELGMLVELEMPFCWANTNVGNHDLDYTVQAQLEAVTFYRAHPAVVAWSLGNESPWSANFQQSYTDFVRRADLSRPFMFDGGRGAPGTTPIAPAWIATRHYPGMSDTAADATAKTPVLYGEYSHLNCYNRREIITDPGVRDAWGWGVAATWEAMWAAQGVLGGCYWAGIDDQFWLPGASPIGYGEWGLIDGWRRAKPETWTVQNIYSPVRVTLPQAQGWEPYLEVENRHDFTDLGELTWAWAAGERRGAGRVTGGPRTTGNQLELVGLTPGSDAVELNVSSPRGFLINRWRVAPPAAPAACLGELPHAVTARGTSGLRELPGAWSPAQCAAACCAARRARASGGAPGSGCDSWLFGLSAQCWVTEGPPPSSSGPLSGFSNYSAAPLRAAPAPSVQPTPDGGLTIAAGAVTWAVSRGGVLSATRAGDALVASGPDLMVLPDNGEGANKLAEDTPPSKPFTPTLSNWTLPAAPSWHVDGSDAVVTLRGSYANASGAYELRFDARGGLSVAYNFTWAGAAVAAPRQIGVVLRLPRAMDRLSWKRQGQWSTYPPDQINRLEGHMVPASPGEPDLGPTPPGGRPWAQDTAPLGTNDFRSTKHQFYSFGLSDAAAARRVSAQSDGTQHGRAWVDAREGISMLVADLSTEGANPFSRQRVIPTRGVKSGSVLSGTARFAAE
eukprot:TRINITY_DN70425_c0_g1_i1.p1 TRINITY_DN70425_c0_g1~~TRINITY_DN70425_c0_g1_i1.p1  ORF type:complete len:1142 (+),score=285.73 TRINITY_DN70425_c0_g1_i1:88-3513(+)